MRSAEIAHKPHTKTGTERWVERSRKALLALPPEQRKEIESYFASVADEALNHTSAKRRLAEFPAIGDISDEDFWVKLWSIGRVHLGLTDEEFWDLTEREFFALLERKFPRKTAETLGARLKSLGREKGLSLRDLAHKAKLDPALVRRHARNKIKPLPPTLKKYADALGVTVKALEEDLNLHSTRI